MVRCDSCFVQLTDEISVTVSCGHFFCQQCIFLSDGEGVCPLHKKFVTVNEFSTNHFRENENFGGNSSGREIQRSPHVPVNVGSHGNESGREVERFHVPVNVGSHGNESGREVERSHVPVNVGSHGNESRREFERSHVPVNVGSHGNERGREVERYHVPVNVGSHGNDEGNEQVIGWMHPGFYQKQPPYYKPNQSRQQRCKPLHFHNSFTHTWTINNYSLYRRDAEKGLKEIIFSEYFYSDTEGYKLCLLFCPNGLGQARGRYLSIYFQIVESEFDAHLNWPCQFKLKFILVDQSNTQDNYEFVMPRRKCLIPGPSKEFSTISKGEKMFFPIEELMPKYLVGDCVVLKVELVFL